MTPQHSAKAWWLVVSIPAWIIAINPVVGVSALLIVAWVLLAE